MFPSLVRIVWTAGWVEPGDKWMMVTIIHLSAAPNPLVGNRQGGTFSQAHLMIQKLQNWCSFLQVTRIIMEIVMNRLQIDLMFKARARLSLSKTNFISFENIHRILIYW